MVLSCVDKNKNLKAYSCVPSISLIYTFKQKTLIVSNVNIFFSLKCLKLHTTYQYKLLTCVSGVDFIGSTYRFLVSYELLSLVFNNRIRVKTYVNEITPVMSVVPLYSCANWWEREVWDLYGVYFSKHPDLRRILTDYGFEGYPMRKDFPLSGFIELYYDFVTKKITLDTVQLSQEMRIFSFETPWE
jgi:NADH/F420H2 dehydrogenase subunit C